ncbi:acyltransferase family protein [Rhizobium mongolense]|uniref:acyltransferase family protein n=1 Tax=Rhizobium mongolense TaxID=57676 RepID=UPI003557A445
MNTLVCILRFLAHVRRTVEQIYTVQYLRGIAAVAVLVFHVSERHNLGFSVGAAGVDLFFVISGFIMWITTDGTTMTPGHFIQKRVKRVVPLYWVVTFATFAALLVKPAFFFDHDGSLQNLIGSLFFLPRLQDSLHPVVVQGWTLTYEMVFYLIFSLTLFFREHTTRLILAIGSLCIMCLASLLLDWPYLRALTSPVILEFAAGLLIGRAFVRGPDCPPWLCIGLAAVALICLAAATAFDADLPRAIRWGVPSALLVLAAVMWERRRNVQPSSMLLFLGNASYSIYLWHVLFGVAIVALLLRSGIPHWAFPPIEVAAALGLSLIAYVYVEKPLGRLINRRFQSRRRAPLATSIT